MKKIVFPGLILLLVLFSSFFTQEETKMDRFKKVLSEVLGTVGQKDYEKATEDAFEYRWKNDYPKALEGLTKAIAMNPKYYRSWFYRGRVYHLMGDYKKAIEDYSKSIEIDGTFYYSLNNRGSMYWQLKEYDKALADYTKAIEQDYPEVMAYNNRGDVYFELKNFSKAIADYKKTVEREPKVAGNYVKLARAYLDQDNYYKAIETYNKALKCNPKEYLAFCNRGLAYYFLKKYEKAMSDFTIAKEMYPEDKWTIDMFSMVDKLVKANTKSLEKNLQVVKETPKEANAFYGLAVCYRDKEQYVEAVGAFTKSLELEKDGTAYNERGKIYLLELNETGKGFADIEKAVELNTKKSTPYITLALYYTKMEDYKKAVEAYDRALGFSPKNSSYKRLREMCYSYISAPEKTITPSEKNKQVPIKKGPADKMLEGLPE